LVAQLQHLKMILCHEAGQVQHVTLAHKLLTFGDRQV
jgi:hypothetical protein